LALRTGRCFDAVAEAVAIGEAEVGIFDSVHDALAEVEALGDVLWCWYGEHLLNFLSGGRTSAAAIGPWPR
jgi:hypothetical protein